MKTELRITCPVCGWHDDLLRWRLTFCPKCKCDMQSHFIYDAERGFWVWQTTWQSLPYTVHSAAVWFKPWTWMQKRYERKEKTQ